MVDETSEKIPVTTEAVTQDIVCRPKPFQLKSVQRDPAKIEKALKAWDSVKELLKTYPEDIRSAQYALDWMQFIETEKL